MLGEHSLSGVDNGFHTKIIEKTWYMPSLAEQEPRTGSGDGLYIPIRVWSRRVNCKKPPYLGRLFEKTNAIQIFRKSPQILGQLVLNSNRSILNWFVS